MAYDYSSRAAKFLTSLLKDSERLHVLETSLYKFFDPLNSVTTYNTYLKTYFKLHINKVSHNKIILLIMK